MVQDSGVALEKVDSLPLFWLFKCSAGRNASETRPDKQRNVRTTEIRGTERSEGWISHLHLPLHQMGPELLSCADDLPLVSQQVHAEVLDVSEGESR